MSWAVPTRVRGAGSVFHAHMSAPLEHKPARAWSGGPCTRRFAHEKYPVPRNCGREACTPQQSCACHGRGPKASPHVQDWPTPLRLAMTSHNRAWICGLGRRRATCVLEADLVDVEQLEETAFHLIRFTLEALRTRYRPCEGDFVSEARCVCQRFDGRPEDGTNATITSPSGWSCLETPWPHRRKPADTHDNSTHKQRSCGRQSMQSVYNADAGSSGVPTKVRQTHILPRPHRRATTLNFGDSFRHRHP